MSERGFLLPERIKARMKETNNRPHILNNLGTKILALVLAAILWLLVNNVNDPVQTKRITNVSVKLLHTSLITDQGEVYSVLDNTDVVPVVTIRARRSIIEDLTRDDIVATADVENLTSLNTVEIKYYSNRYNSEIEEIDGSLDNVMLSIEPKLTDSFALQTETSGSVASGYELDSMAPEQNQIRVSGPESIVSSIVAAKATVDVSGATSSITTYADVKLVDANGDTVDASKLTMNITTVKVNVTILPLKTVPVEVSVSGTPAEGYLRNGVVTADPETVKLAGRSSILADIDKITIPASAVDVTGCTSSYQGTVNIKDYLPDGVSLADSKFDGTVNITVGIEAAETSEINIGLTDVSLENVPDGYRAKLVSVSDGKKTVTEDSAPANFGVSITGLTSVVDAIKVSDLSPAIDVGSLVSSDSSVSGHYTVAVALTVPDGVTVNNTVTAEIELTELAAYSRVSAADTDN